MPHHVGVAIELPEPHRSFVHRRRVHFGDPSAALMPPHVTLLPPTLVKDSNVDDVVDHLSRVAADAAPFEVRLLGTATFRPVTPTVFIPLAVGAAACEQLERAVRSGPLRRRLPFPFHPHVTVGFEMPDEALDAVMADLSAFSASFVVSGFSMYELGSDGVWRPVAEFELGSG